MPAPAVNVTEAIVTEPEEEDLTTLVGIVNNSTVTQTLEANETYIICAPTDEAFAGLGNETLSIILNDTGLLDSILSTISSRETTRSKNFTDVPEHNRRPDHPGDC